MKSYKKIMPIFLVALLVLTVFYSVQSKAGVQSDYRSALTLARDYAEKGIVTDAISQYETAYELNPTVEILLEAGEVYLDNGDYNSAVKWYSNELLTNYPKEAETYLYGITVYLDLENYRSAYEVYDEYQGRGFPLRRWKRPLTRSSMNTT